MIKLWPLLLILATACNVANEPKPLEASGIEANSGTMTLANVSTTRNEGSGTVSLVVSISRAQSVATTINYTLAGTAVGGAACTAGIDYIAPPGFLVLGAGARTGVVDIPLCADSLYEGNENFLLSLTTSSPALGAGLVSSTTVTILDAGTPPPVYFDVASSGTIVEGEVGNTVVPVDIELAYPSAFPITVDVLTSGTATLGVDYTISATQVSFPAGTTTASVFVTIIGDTTVELNESIVLSFFNPFNAVIGQQPTHTILIGADETPNPIQVTMIGIVPQAENVVGDVNVIVQVDGFTDHPITLQYGVDNGGVLTAPRRATFGPGGDLMFPPTSSVAPVTTVGAGNTATATLAAFTTGFISLPLRILDDAIYEGQESARIQLIGGPEVSVVGTGVAEVIINDNETQPLVSFLTATQNVPESNTVQTAVIRLVNALGAEVVAGEDVVVTLTTSPGTTNTVVGRTDWSMGLGSITIPAGASRVSLPYSTLLDGVDEDQENFTINLFPPAGYAAAVGGANLQVNIIDVDPAPRVNFEVATQAGVVENTAGALTINLELDAQSERSVTVNYMVTGLIQASACGGSVDLANPGSVTIPANSVMPFALTGVSVCDDVIYEDQETATFTLTSATNATIGSLTSHSVTITDDETPPNLGITASTTRYNEGQSVAFSISVAATAKPFTLTYATTGTASTGLDHNIPASGFINVPASSVAQVIPLNGVIVNDANPENDETIIVTVSSSSTDANIVTPAATVTINANDALQLAVGRRHTCGLLQGAVKCWGHGPALGRGSAVDYGAGATEVISALQPVNLGSGFSPVKITAGVDFTCALSSAGAVKCWGSNLLGSLGQDRASVAGQPSEYIGDAAGEMGNNLPAVQLGGTAIDVQTSSESSHVCALLSSNRIKCWGQNQAGQVGLDEGAGACNAATPNTGCIGDHFGEVAALSFLEFPNSPGATVQRVSVGANHTCAHLSTNQVFCWGDNTSGALGVDSNDALRYLHEAPFASPVLFNAAFDGAELTQLSANEDRTCATFNNAGAFEAVCWGDGSSGSHGLGNTNNAGTVALPLAALNTSMDFSPFTVLTSGVKVANGHACARGEDFSVPQVYCWGENGNGQLGNGGGADTNTPIASAALGPFTDIYVGTSQSCAVNGAFQYVCWGINTSGSAGAQVAGDIATPGTPMDFQ